MDIVIMVFMGIYLPCAFHGECRKFQCPYHTQSGRSATFHGPSCSLETTIDTTRNWHMYGEFEQGFFSGGGGGGG